MRICALPCTTQLAVQSHRSVDERVEVNNTCLWQVEVLKGIHLSATRCTNILRLVLGLYFLRQLVQILRDTYFSIIPHETTDVSTEKQLGICVVYFNEKIVRPVTRIFDTVAVEQSTAVGHYEAIKSSL